MGSHTCHLVCLTVGTLHSALRGKGQLSAEPHLLFLLSFLLWEDRRSTSLVLIHTYTPGRWSSQGREMQTQPESAGQTAGEESCSRARGNTGRVTLTLPLRGDHVCSQSDLSNCWVRCSKSHTRLLDVLLAFCVFAVSLLCRETMTHQADVLAVSQPVLPHLLPS